MGRHVPTHIRHRILARDHHTCQQCHTTTDTLDIDHIAPLGEGGTDDDSNLRALCTHCHSVKTRQEIIAGHHRRASAGKFPREQHPGLVIPPGGCPQR